MFSIELEGWRQFIATLTNVPVESRTAKFMAGVATTLKNDARMNAPVKSGLLRVSIQDSHGADASGGFAEVGIANGLFYAPYMEYGTGLVHDHPNWPRERHMPFVKRDPENGPVPALVAYADWKWGSGYAGGLGLARAIAKRGGIKPKRFLRNALANRREMIIEGWRELLHSLSRSLTGGTTE